MIFIVNILKFISILIIFILAPISFLIIFLFINFMDIKRIEKDNNKKNFFHNLDNYFEKTKKKIKDITRLDFFDWCNLSLFILGVSIIIGVWMFNNIDDRDFLQAIILFFTGITILQYTKETYWLKDINRKKLDHDREINLRPVILRSEYVKNYDNISHKNMMNIDDKKVLGDKPLEFTIFKNIAKDINGYVVINGYKHPLHFASKITQVEEHVYAFLTNWGWMNPGYKLYAIYDDATKEKTDEDNYIRIDYKDIEGNEYYTIEDKNFSQTSFKK